MGQAELLELLKTRGIYTEDKAMRLNEIADLLGLNATSVVHNIRRLVKAGDIKYVTKNRARYYYINNTSNTPAENKFKIRDTIRDKLVEQCVADGFLMLRNLRPSMAFYKSAAAILCKSGFFYTPDPPEWKHNPGRKFYLTDEGLAYYNQKQKRKELARSLNNR